MLTAKSDQNLHLHFPEISSGSFAIEFNRAKLFVDHSSTQYQFENIYTSENI